MRLGDTGPRRALRPDAQAFDEIRVVTVPRYKQSGLSGDEWRISARVDFYRKGQLVHQSGSFRNVESACNFMGWIHATAVDEGKAMFGGEGDRCDQEGCDAVATVTLRLKKEFCREGHESDPSRLFKGPLIRQFCDVHKTRGDCALEDADANYETVSTDVS